MQFLGFEEEFLKDMGGIHTAREIQSQPSLWLNVYTSIVHDTQALQKFLNNAVHEADKIILTGAGSSAYIGLSLNCVYNRRLGKTALAIPTTDLVTHPENYYFKNETILLVSFARSGNSPESTAAVELADKFCKKVFHLVITCDKTGNLALLKSANPRYVLVLPPESNDQSLAMTGSYSGMLLSGLLIAHLDEIAKLQATVSRLHDYGRKIIEKYGPEIKRAAELPFNRAVFLGSGPFYGTSTESALKLQELTDGRIICKNDSFLGLRHGPKAVIDDTTLLFFIFSGNPYVLLYEKDLVNSTKKGNKPLITMGISENPVKDCVLDTSIRLSEEESHIEDEFLTVCNIIPGQMLGFYKSLATGLKPDNPSVSGAISRVVEDFRIYNY
jgi:tagatose-6-phosphate ketose/aldose isomerase